MKLGLREANQRFSKAIRAVRAGKKVVLTDRGRPIAVITPLERQGTEEEALRALAHEGLITLPTRRGPMSVPRWRPIRIKGKPLSDTVIEDREDQA